MDTKNTILSQKDLNLLETLILQCGRVVSNAQIQVVVGDVQSKGALRKRVAHMSKAGWLLRLKKGLYLVITSVSTLGFNDVSEYVIAQTFNQDSYVSFEYALQYYSMFDQLLARLDSVSTKTARTYKVLMTTYMFFKIKNNLYFGFEEVVMDNQKVKIAEKEKAILDMLYFRSSDYVADLVLEKLTEYKDEFDFNKLKEYCTKYSLSMVRKIGFLLDQIGVDTADLLARSNSHKNSYNRFSATSDKFNAKWRLYYASSLIKQTSTSVY
jgi:predicted transcriptional regulator of viral defense system